MRSIRRTSGIGQAWSDVPIRDIALVCLADGIVGASLGAIAVSAGFPLWLPVLLSLVVFAGASQFIFIGVLAAGGNVVAAVVGSLVVNARLVPLGFAVGQLFGGSAARTAVGAHLVTDESVAFVLAQRDPIRKRHAFWITGIGLFVSWNIGVAVGGVAGTVITDTDAWGLDAAFPAVLVALVMPALRERTTRRAAAAGSCVALAASLVLPSGLPVLLSLVAVVPILLRRVRA